MPWYKDHPLANFKPLLHIMKEVDVELLKENITEKINMGKTFYQPHSPKWQKHYG